MMSRLAIALIRLAMWGRNHCRPLYHACMGILWLLAGKEGRRSRTMYTTVHIKREEQP